MYNVIAMYTFPIPNLGECTLEMLMVGDLRCWECAHVVASE